MPEYSEGQSLNLMQALAELDEQIATLNESKRDLFADAREQMSDLPKKDVALFLSAIKKVVADDRKARTKPEAVEADAERDLIAERLAALLASAPARRTCAPAIITDWDAVKATRQLSSHTDSDTQQAALPSKLPGRRPTPAGSVHTHLPSCCSHPGWLTHHTLGYQPSSHPSWLFVSLPRPGLVESESFSTGRFGTPKLAGFFLGARLLPAAGGNKVGLGAAMR